VNKAIPHATESLASVSNVASLLQQNAIQDYQVYIKACAAMRRGVSSTPCLLLRSLKATTLPQCRNAFLLSPDISLLRFPV